MSGVVILSGGIDSATVAYEMRDQAKGIDLLALTFNYGQRHDREVGAARNVAGALGARHKVVDIGLRGIMPGSCLTDSQVPVPHGHYEAESMKDTVVPARNAIFLAVAFASAMAHGATWVGAGFHGGDHHIYPDCRPGFVAAMEGALRLTVDAGERAPLLFTPFIHRSKADIIRRGAELGVPFELTWTCYEGGRFHCGRCGSCVERREAFKEAGVPDPTEWAS